jgi:hypothetical protein
MVFGAKCDVAGGVCARGRIVGFVRSTVCTFYTCIVRDMLVFEAKCDVAGGVWARGRIVGFVRGTVCTFYTCIVRDVLVFGAKCGDAHGIFAATDHSRRADARVFVFSIRTNRIPAAVNINSSSAFINVGTSQAAANPCPNCRVARVVVLTDRRGSSSARILATSPVHAHNIAAPVAINNVVGSSQRGAIGRSAGSVNTWSWVALRPG